MPAIAVTQYLYPNSKTAEQLFFEKKPHSGFGKST
jgi:hypothetical protein